ncbi:uncharacterized protein LOC143869923 [Tasmannia lanceolata]|uniref:uncharacterized protein LOC143869923 n=1 Tax=Tasmannia lanceolata TaxID=3420 RepID=UPI004063D026
MRFLSFWDSPDSRKFQISVNFNYKHNIHPLSAKICKWNLPVLGELKLNTDASLSNEGRGIGGLIRNHFGEVACFFSMNVLKEEIYILEIRAICEGVAAASRLGIRHLWIEADSSFAVDVFNEKSQTPWRSITKFDTAKAYLDGIQWKISHIWREANSAVDYLSKRDCLCKGEDIPLDNIPVPLSEILKNDAEGKEYQRL